RTGRRRPHGRLDGLREASQKGFRPPTTPLVHDPISNFESCLRCTHRADSTGQLRVKRVEFTFRYPHAAHPWLRFLGCLAWNRITNQPVCASSPTKGQGAAKGNSG